MSNTEVKKQVLDAFNFRHACKIFDADKKISDDDFAFILETARLSPSSFGFEPWSFVILEDERIKGLLSPHCWGATNQMPTASVFLIILAKKRFFMNYDSDYLAYMMQEIQKLPEDILEQKPLKVKQFQESDFDIANERAMFDWACKQCYIALSNMLTSAAIIGIDSCPIEGFSRHSVEKVLSEESTIDMSKYGVACMASFGYRIKNPRKKTRQSLESIVETL